jgi:hypothetical protein
LRLIISILCVALSAPSTALAADAALEFDCLVEARQDIDVRSPVEGVIEKSWSNEARW